MLVQNNIYDVVIVGAGPAGLKCGEILAQQGLKVIILEKNNVLGQKVCAGGMAADYTQIGIPEEIIEKNFFNHKIFANQKSFAIHLTHPLIIFDRQKLSQWQADQAQTSGCQILTRHQVTHIDKNFVLARNKKFYFTYLIGADGGQSIVRQHLNLKNKKIGVALEYHINQTFDKILWHFIPRLFSCCYVWFFPHQNYTSVGVAATLNSKNINQLKNKFNKFLDKLGVLYNPQALKGCLINCDYQGYKFKDNKFLIGEAAGLVSGLTGEGIYSAIISGQEIARLILNPNYQPIKLQQILRDKKRQEIFLFLWQKSGILKNLILQLGIHLICNKNWHNKIKKYIYGSHLMPTETA